MDWVKFDYAHSLSLAEANAKVSAAAKAICARYQLGLTTAKGRADLSGRVLRGTISAHRNKLSISIALVGEVTPTRASVTAGFREALDSQFASPAGGR